MFLLHVSFRLSGRYLQQFIFGFILQYLFAIMIFDASVLLFQFELFTAKHHWTIGLLANFIGYCSVFLPGVAVVYYVESSGYLSPGGATDGCLAPILKRCFYGTSLDISESISASVEYKKVVCFNYLTLTSNCNFIIVFLG